LIDPTNTIITKKYIELKEKYGIDNLFAKKIFERRMVDNVKIAILVNEIQATLDLPLEDGETDFNDLFYSNNYIFMNGAETILNTDGIIQKSLMKQN
jgi:hypothetical protein